MAAWSRGRTAVTAPVVALAIGALGAPGGLAAPAPARLSGQGCTSAVAIIAMPLARAQAAVPAPFHAFDYGNLVGTGRVQFTKCDKLDVDGGGGGPATLSSVSIDVEPPKGAPGASVHSYDLWTLVSRGDAWSRYAEWGMTGGLVPELALEDLTPEPIAASRGDAPWTRASYGAVVTTPDPTEGLVATTNESHWHKGPNGTLCTASTVQEVFHAGAAAVQSGGEVADLFNGLPVMAAAGMRRTFTFRATIEGVRIGT